MWKTVKGFSKYEVNEEGIIRNKKTQRIKSIRPNNSGYYIVSLSKDDKGVKTLLVSRVVATTWLPNPDNLPQVDHLDRNPANNAVSNLEWVSKEENIRRKPKSIRSVKKKVRPIAQYDLKGNLIAVYPSIMEASRQTGISDRCIGRVVRGEYGRITTGGYKWGYYNE